MLLSGDGNNVSLLYLALIVEMCDINFSELAYPKDKMAEEKF